MTANESRMNASLNTESGHFSQVVAVSQAAINRQLGTLFDKFPLLQTIKVSSQRAGQLEAKLKPPRVSLVVDTNTKDVVKYYCEFESGTLKLTASVGGGFDPEINLAGWRFVFKVNIGSINKAEDSTLHEDRKPTGTHAPGDYSVKQLFLDFNTSTIMQPEQSECTTNGHTWKKQDDSAAFNMLVSMWGVDVAKNPDSTTLGDVTTHNDPKMSGTYLSTFPPTDLIFQTYGYIAPGKVKPDVNFEGTADSNMLLYLEMTGKKDFPIERVLLNKGNFITPGMDGTLTICRENFWDNFLLNTVSPLLVAYNRATWAWVRSISAKAELNTGLFKSNYGVGSESGPTQESEFYAWKKDGQCSWKWSKSNQKSTEDKGSIQNASIEISCNTDNEMSFNPNTNEIIVKGKTRLESKIKIGLDRVEASETIQWEEKITIGSIDKTGNLSVNLFHDPKQFKPVTQTNSRGPFHDKELAQMKKQVEDSMNQNTLDATREKLSSALTGLGRFIVPTGQTFNAINPKFNNTGDLLFELEYRHE